MKIRFLLTILLSCFLFSSLSLGLSAQERRTVSGRVVDQNGEPLIGAGVVLKGNTRYNTLTDQDGNFKIEIPAAGNPVLEFTFLGQETTNETVGNRSVINVTLKAENSLDEVIVVGYGTARRKDLTGSLSAVSGNELATKKTNNLSRALQGSVAGVMVTRGGDPTGGATIRIRGITTMSTNDPLILIDGIPGDLNSVNPDDVENITVLKDAASASIYGSRAAAGVILVTTKRAKEGNLSVTYDFEYSIDTPTKFPKFYSIKDYLTYENEVMYNDHPDLGDYQRYSKDEVENWETYSKTDPDHYPNVDWKKVMVNNWAPHQTHSLDIMGGGKVVSSKASIRYDDRDFLYDVRDYRRYMIRLNNDVKIKKWLKLSLDGTYQLVKSKSPQAGGSLIGDAGIPAIYAVKYSNGRWGDVKEGGNPKAILEDGGWNESWTHNMGVTGGVHITPFEGLTISAVFSPQLTFYKGKEWLVAVPYYSADDAETIRGYMNQRETSTLAEYRNDTKTLTSQIFANFEKSFGSHNVSAMVGYEDYYSFTENNSSRREGFDFTTQPYLSMGQLGAYNQGAYGGSNTYAYRSYFGRVSYSYANRYLVQFNIRRDGSSRFHPDYRWATFPSVSLGWVVTEEPWIKNLNINWLSYFKLRGSWGQLGNERIGSLYPYQQMLATDAVILYNYANEKSMKHAHALKDYAVKDISWETTESFDIGVDMYFLNNRLRFTGDTYRKNTKDMLLALEIPRYSGFNNPTVNAGKMHTTGYDIELEWKDRAGEVSYSVAANFSDFTSRMGDLKGTEFLGSQIIREGTEYNEWYGYKTDGLFLTQEDVNNSPKVNNNTDVGDIKYVDISGPDGKPDGKISPEYDRVPLGGSFPRYIYGLNASASWKDFDFALSFQGVGKWNKTKVNLVPWNCTEAWRGNYWSLKNTDEQNAKVDYPRITNLSNNNGAMSDFKLFNGKYFRLQNITIGYTLPKKIVRKADLESVRVYFAGGDLFSISNYPKGYDPEVQGGYLLNKSFTFGIQVKL